MVVGLTNQFVGIWSGVMALRSERQLPESLSGCQNRISPYSGGTGRRGARADLFKGLRVSSYLQQRFRG